MLIFRKIWHALFSCNIHFEICPFASLLAICFGKFWLYFENYNIPASLPQVRTKDLLSSLPVQKKRARASDSSLFSNPQQSPDLSKLAILLCNMIILVFPQVGCVSKRGGVKGVSDHFGT